MRFAASIANRGQAKWLRLPSASGCPLSICSQIYLANMQISFSICSTYCKPAPPSILTPLPTLPIATSNTAIDI